jgi:hypothetical protein
VYFSALYRRFCACGRPTTQLGCEGMQTTFSFLAGFDIEGMVSKLIVFSMLRRTHSSSVN